MKKIKLTQGQFAIVDDSDYEILGGLKWTSWRCNKTNRFYAYRKCGVKNLFMHRVILGIHDKNIKVDHRNHNGLDNRRKNIRPASHQENMMNRSGPRRGSASGIRGVSWDKNSKKWVSRIKVNGKEIHLGRFKSKIIAGGVYADANRNYFNDFGGKI